MKYLYFIFMCLDLILVLFFRHELVVPNCLRRDTFGDQGLTRQVYGEL